MHDKDPIEPADPPSDARDDVAALLDFAGRRPQLPEAEVAPIRAAVHEAFRRQARRAAQRRRLVWGTGGSLAAALLVTIGLMLRPPAAPEAGPAIATVATIEMRFGDVTVPGSRIFAGTILRTGDGGRAAVRLPSGESLRIDSRSAVRFDSPRLVTLEQGALYVDANPALPRGPGLEIATPLGFVRHVGTQFETRLLTGGEPGMAALRIRVREGTVLVRRAGKSQKVRAGGELLLPESGTPRRSEISVYGPDWGWVQRTARPFEIEGARLSDFLDWASRETGLQWQLDAARAGNPRDVILHGSIEGLTAEEALSVVLPSCGYRSRRAGNRLWIESAGP